MNVAPYRKAVIAAAAASAELVRVTADGTLTTSDAVGIAIAFLAAFGVYQVANKPAADAD